MRYLNFISFLLIFFHLISYANANSSYLMGLRGGDLDLEKYCKSINCSKKNIIKSETIEFSNGNTFVRIQDNVSYKNLIIVSPERLNPDQFMELLIKIRALKENYANTINVVTSSLSNKLTIVNYKNKKILSSNLVDRLLSEAGAMRINEKALPKYKPFKIDISTLTKTLVVDMETNSALSNEIANEMRLPNIKASSIKDDQSLRFNKILLISSVADPHNLSFLLTLNQIYMLKKLGAYVNLITPYLPYARSDKKDQAGVSVIGKLAANLIEVSGADTVNFVRAHAPQSQGFFNIPTTQTTSRETINDYLLSIGVEQIISPDAGAQKETTLYADALNLPISVINKQRDTITGESKLHDMSGPSVKGKVVAVIDDETASGGTLGKAAKFLKEQGATKVIAVVTHLAGNAKQALESDYLDLMVVTNTFEVKTLSPKLKVLSIARELSKDIQNVHFYQNKCSKILE